MFFLVRNKFGYNSWLKFESAKNQVKRARILASIVFGDEMFAIIEIFIVFSKGYRKIYRKLEGLSDFEIIKTGNS